MLILLILLSEEIMKIASIVGARPNFIKLAPVSRETRKEMEEIIIHTGQHYDYEMDRIFFQELGIPDPDYHLGIGSGTHGRQTGEMLKVIEEILLKEQPDIALVFGDTNTTLAGALAAAKLHIPVAHVEAGLRSFNKKMPEEVNRVLVDHCSDFLFCPTKTAVENLHKESIADGVSLTGDVMLDILQECIHIAEKSSKILEELELRPKEYFLATVHRAENTDDPEKLQNIAEALSSIENVIFPCHPRTKKRLEDLRLWDQMRECVQIINPVGYLDMLLLEKNAYKILTDSGGVQKEAYMLQTPCITMRDETEWVETVEDGWNLLVGSNKNTIIKAANEFEPTCEQRDVFGSGDASHRTIETIDEYSMEKAHRHENTVQRTFAKQKPGRSSWQ
jgi:UDP-N-acetylglucosamine 2-epimerase